MRPCADFECELFLRRARKWRRKSVFVLFFSIDGGSLALFLLLSFSFLFARCVLVPRAFARLLFLKRAAERARLSRATRGRRAAALDALYLAAKKREKNGAIDRSLGQRPSALASLARLVAHLDLSPPPTPHHTHTQKKLNKISYTTARKTPSSPTPAPRPRSTLCSRPRRTPGSTSTPTRTSP